MSRQKRNFPPHHSQFRTPGATRATFRNLTLRGTWFFRQSESDILHRPTQIQFNRFTRRFVKNQNRRVCVLIDRRFRE